MKRNDKPGAIAILEQFVNEQYAKTQQWLKQEHFLAIFIPTK